ncbi:MAG: UDP-N-acetylglucosamine 1-carboxyvinyltransferase [Christensenellales bacterium]|jgi:UDP-N-acetylglucosamine 1-carboxyvinyltransferase
MDKILINGGKKLFGSVDVSSAKNACLPILAAAILCEDNLKLLKIPNFEDIDVMCEILKSLNFKVMRYDDVIEIDGKSADVWVLPKEHTEKIRSSIFCLGSILSRFKKAVVSYPGGCSIGKRPIDIHIKGLKDLGVITKETPDGLLVCDGSKMKSATVKLDFPSVGATENIMLASVYLKGTTKILNAAKEPEIVDLANLLNAMGARITGAGTSQIEIKGVKKLKGVTYTPIPDRIITGTILIGGLMTGGKICLQNVIPSHVMCLIEKLGKTSCNIGVKNDTITLEAYKRPKTFGKLETQPFPDFPTDLQSQMLTLATISKGKATVVENLFETRFKQVPYLIDMGAHIKLDGKTVFIKGVKHLEGKTVKAEDLRGGASLILAGLVASGTTVVEDVFHIDRGYENIENIFGSLGADIKRIKW